MSLRVIIAAGGTGGHVFPGIAVARELQRREPGVRLLFVGTRRGLEARVVPREGFDLEFIDIAGLKRVGASNLLRTLWLLPRSLWQAGALRRRFHPDIVLGVGGYVSGPILLEAGLSGIPTLVIEPNAYPGFTNRLLSRLIRAAAVGFPEAAAYFHGKAVVTGNPVRPEFLRISQSGAAASTAGGSAFHLLILGGSQGSLAINQAVTSALPTLLRHHRQLTVTHQTGQLHVEAVRRAYASLEGKERINIQPFIHAFAQEVARAHLVIARAGAMTVAELTAAGKPAILIPLPTAADDHQRKNAEALERQGAARCLPQSELTPERLVADVSALIENPTRLAAMAAASRRLAHPAAAEKIVDLVYQLVGRSQIADGEAPQASGLRHQASGI